MIRAKMKVVGVDTQFHREGEGAMIKLDCVYDSSSDNESWSKWTPSGQISLNVTNPEAVKQFLDWNLRNVYVSIDFDEFVE